MYTNDDMIKDSSLCNSINSKSFSFANRRMRINRSVILSNYKEDIIDSCWDSLVTNVIQNYQRGKGTYIKGFGTFTFKQEEYNLEGTTNQNLRDKRPKQPIFIMSKEFNDQCSSGEYSEQNFVRIYSQKENKDIPIVKLNPSEIAYSISISKDEVLNILNHLIKHLSESINNNTFKNKVMTGLGTLICKNKIVAVKFNKKFIYKIKHQNHKLNITKRNIFLNQELDNVREFFSNDNVNFVRNMRELRATTALNTHVLKRADNYLKTIYDIDIKKIPQHKIRDIFNVHDNKRKTFSFKFINDEKSNDLSKGRIVNKPNKDNSPLFNLDEEIIKNIEFSKGILIINCKNYDKKNKGVITKDQMMEVLTLSGISTKLDYNNLKSIVDYYNKEENVEYMKFIAQIIKDSKAYLITKNKKHNKILNSIDLNKIKHKDFFSLSITQNDTVKNTIDTTYSKIYRVKENTLPVTKTLGNVKPKKMSISKKFNLKKGLGKSAKKIFDKDEINIIENNEKLPNETEEDRKKLLYFFSLLPLFRDKYYTSYDQKISINEFIRILNTHEIYYPKRVIEPILRFLGITDLNAFSLREFDTLLKTCKKIETSIGLNELTTILKELKDVVYTNGGFNFFFNNEINPNNTLSCENFIKLLKDKLNYDENTLRNVFLYMVRKERDFTEKDFIKFFGNILKKETNLNGQKNIFDEDTCINIMKNLILLMKKRVWTPEEYFSHLLKYNTSTKEKTITRTNWIKYLQNEIFNLSSKDLDELFYWVDTKKDGVIDLEEFINRYHYALKPLTIIKNIISTNKLDIEDLAHRMKMSVSELELYDFETFKSKVRNLDGTLPEEFIKSIFDDLKNKNNSKPEKELIESKIFLGEINYVKPKESYKSFTKKYINAVKSKINYNDFKKKLEVFDPGATGTITRLEYVTTVKDILSEFNDEEHMKFIRIKDMFNSDGNITYLELLNVIYYFNEETLNDSFSKLCRKLSEILVDQCDNSIDKLMFLIDKGYPKKNFTLILSKPLTISQIKNYLNKINVSIPDLIIQKLDIDADGLISYDDLKAVLHRFTSTSFFKYYNDSTQPNINLFCKETLSNLKIASIVNKIEEYMKKNGLNKTSFFSLFDKENNGFITNIDFNTTIDEIVPMGQAMKDQFFNYLDYYHNGMVDLDTFKLRLNYNRKNFIPEENLGEIENQIVKDLKEFILSNKNLSIDEIFQVIDKDCDGLIKEDDIDKFVSKNLNISQNQYNKSNLKRVLMRLSLTKNLHVGINDLKEFIDTFNKDKDYMNLEEVFELTTNQNLSELKKNKDWINNVIEKLGMYISEKYDNIEQFLNENIPPCYGTKKFKIEDFINFHQKNYELFNLGFDLSKDELISVYSSLDSQKKGYLTLLDLKNKLEIFNFYNKMHIDIRNFLQGNFLNGIDAFKYFIKQKNKEENSNQSIRNETDISKEKDKEKYSITIKDFYDTFENFFPKKYATNTILKYLSKYFGINVEDTNKNNLQNKKENITFEEFNTIYFGKFEDNNTFINKKALKTKIKIIGRSENIDISKENKSDNFYFSNKFKKKFSKLSTSFDNDPMYKLKRILQSSNIDLNKIYISAALECGNNNCLINKHQLRNIIKSLKLGITNLEIDKIIMQSDDRFMIKDKINLRDFVHFLYRQNPLIEEIKKNIAPLINEIKSLVNKFYSNPLICFQINDVGLSGTMDFEQFKNIIFDLYRRDTRPPPNFILIKNGFDAIDLRKDGIIDLNEWCKALSNYNGLSSVISSQETINNNNNNYLCNRRLETDINETISNKIDDSSTMIEMYKLIKKNRKIIKSRMYQCNYLYEYNGEQYINSENLLFIIKEIVPNNKLSLLQWKEIINIAKNESMDNLINVNNFFKLIEISTKTNYLSPSRNIRMSNSIDRLCFSFSTRRSMKSWKKDFFNNRKIQGLIKRKKINLKYINFGVSKPNDNIEEINDNLSQRSSTQFKIKLTPNRRLEKIKDKLRQKSIQKNWNKENN